MIHLTRPLTAFDVETTTPNPQTARIVQIAIIRLHPNGERDTYSTLVNPTVPIPAESTAVHGITDAMVADKPTFAQLAPRLLRAFQNCEFLGYNIARFDLPVIREEFKRAGIDTTVPEGVEPPRIFDPFVIWRKQEPRTLADAARKFLGRELVEAHNAIADVEATLAIAEMQLLTWPDLPQSVEGLHDLCWPTNPHAIDVEGKFEWDGDTAVVAFSKHKGAPITSMDNGFWKWVLKNDFADDTKQIARDALQGRYPVKKEAA